MTTAETIQFAHDAINLIHIGGFIAVGFIVLCVVMTIIDAR